jgi:CO dehydrogenase maturation factor
MATTIAISGKGGSGKTTTAAMIIRFLLEQANSGSILAVDADPNSCLGLTLGVEPVSTVADIREDTRSKPPTNTGMDRVRSVEYGIQQAITESKGFDLLTMGRPEGPDCYCAVNNLLRRFLDKLNSQYRYVVIDNEAGMEHLSRRTTNNVDVLCIVAEPTPIGSVTAERISSLAGKLPISVKRIGILWNKTAEKMEYNTRNDVESFGNIHYDKGLFDASSQGKTVFDLKENNPAYLSVSKIIERILATSSSRAVSNQ